MAVVAIVTFIPQAFVCRVGGEAMRAMPEQPIDTRAAERFRVVLLNRRADVAVGGLERSCADRAPGSDVLDGTVLAIAASAGQSAESFEGVLQRLTEQPICGLLTLPRVNTRIGAQPCRAWLSGVGDVHVRIKVPGAGADRPSVWVVITPVDVSTQAKGNCSPGEMRERRRAYSDRFTIEFPAPGGTLVTGRFLSLDEYAVRWEMTVTAAPEEIAR